MEDTLKLTGPRMGRVAVSGCWYAEEAPCTIFTPTLLCLSSSRRKTFLPGAHTRDPRNIYITHVRLLGVSLDKFRRGTQG